MQIGFDLGVQLVENHEEDANSLNLDKIRELSFLKGLAIYLWFIQLSVDKSKTDSLL